MSLGGSFLSTFTGVVLQRRINDLNMSMGGSFLGTFMEIDLHERINDQNMSMEGVFSAHSWGLFYMRGLMI